MRMLGSLASLARLLLIAILGASGGTAAAPAQVATLAFEENRGQFPEDVRFGVRGEGFALWLSPDDGQVLRRRGRCEDGEEQDLRMRLIGAAPNPEVRGEDALPGRIHYLVGRREAWKRDVRSFARVRYADVYPGIDLVYHDRGGRIEYDFVVSPGADPGPIAMRFDGADAVEIADDGSLAVLTGAQSLSISAPELYQEGPEGREAVAGYFRKLDGTTVALGLGAYDASRALVIDPVVLGYASRLGGAGRDELHDLAVDASAAVYVTGATDAAFSGASGAPCCGSSRGAALPRSALLCESAVFEGRKARRPCGSRHIRGRQGICGRPLGTIGEAGWLEHSRESASSILRRCSTVHWRP